MRFNLVSRMNDNPDTQKKKKVNKSKKSILKTNIGINCDNMNIFFTLCLDKIEELTKACTRGFYMYAHPLKTMNET